MQKTLFRAWKKQRELTIVIAICLRALAVGSPLLFPGGLGLNKGQSTVVKTEQKLSEGITEETTVTDGSGKTVWDWLSLLGVPLSLALLGAWFQSSQQKQASEDTKEEVLQVT